MSLELQNTLVTHEEGKGQVQQPVKVGSCWVKSFIARNYLPPSRTTKTTSYWCPFKYR